MTEYYTTAVLYWQAAIRLFVMKCYLYVTKCFAMATPMGPEQIVLSLTLALGIFLPEYLLYRYDHDDQTEEGGE